MTNWQVRANARRQLLCLDNSPQIHTHSLTQILCHSYHTNMIWMRGNSIFIFLHLRLEEVRKIISNSRLMRRWCSMFQVLVQCSVMWDVLAPHTVASKLNQFLLPLLLRLDATKAETTTTKTTTTTTTCNLATFTNAPCTFERLTTGAANVSQSCISICVVVVVVSSGR